MNFTLNAPFAPTGDQPQAIESLSRGINSGLHEQVLLGVTGSGKTFTIANVIANTQRPTLIISHNKTLAAQLYQEFKEFFPENAVSYFVSYYDYYQPEAYVPQTDTYIEKETEINEEIDKLRLAATTNLLTRSDTIIVASVSSIYNIGSPREYGHFVLELQPGVKVDRKAIMERLIQLQYERNDFGFHRGTFRVRGSVIDIFPAYEDTSVRIICNEDKIISLERIDSLTGKTIDILRGAVIYPAKHYMTDPKHHKEVFTTIEKDLAIQVSEFTAQGKFVEAQRIKQRVTYDLEMIKELGYVNGIENYSRYFDGRKPGDPPYSLFDYYQEATNTVDKWLLIIDESHMTIPQIRGMYNGDRARKQTLIDYGFRLPASLDNRPMRFDEFQRMQPQTIYVSATPNEWEIHRALESARNSIARDSGLRYRKSEETTQSSKLYTRSPGVVEQLIRPTGLVDPEIEIRPSTTQVQDVTCEIEKRISKNERILVTTLTKRMAEDLSAYLEEKKIKVHYLHADILTLKRTDILADLRNGVYDVVVGVNLLREGLDLPEVSLVAILDADREGFLRSKTSLIQTMGRAARHIDAKVILYADRNTDSMKAAIDEVDRRRIVQLQYNAQHKITPQGISKPVREKLVEGDGSSVNPEDITENDISDAAVNTMTPLDREKIINKLKKLMREASHDLRFEEAMKYRDMIEKMVDG